MKRILMLCDHYARTGYGVVSEQIVAHLTNHFGTKLGLHIVATNYFGEPTQVVLDGIHTVYVESAKLSQDAARTPEHLEQDDFGRMVFLDRLVNSDFDGIFIMQDLGIVTPMIPVLRGVLDGKKKANKKQFKSVFYFPVDCQLPKKYFEGIEFFDLIVTYTEYGRKQLLEYNPALMIKSKVIHHGVSASDYHKLEPNMVRSFREEYFNDGAKELFIIGAINRNQPRKDIPATIFGFAELKKSWAGHQPRPFLYLHMHPKDAKGWDLPLVLDQCGLVEGYDYMFPKTDDVNYQVDVATMNKIYNTIDLYVSTSRGEGWGLTATEAMAVGKLCVLPYHTSYMEIGAKRCLFLTDFYQACGVDDSTVREACFYLDVAEQIEQAYRFLVEGYPTVKDNVLEEAYKYMQKLRWANVCKEWISVFKQIY